MGNENTKTKAPNRIAALITYVIAFACMAVGLFLPLGPKALAEFGTANDMLALQLLDAVGKAIPSLNLDLSNIMPDAGFAYTLAPLTMGSFTINFGALTAVLYGLIFVAGLIALIPVIANTASKKATKNTALAAASFIEVLASVALLALVLFRLDEVLVGGGIGAFNCLALIIACGGTLLMLIVQSFIYKKGSGAIKFILMLLSAVAVLLCVFDITKIIPSLADTLNGIPAAIGFGSLGLYGDVTAISVFNDLCAGTLSFEGVEATKMILLIGAIAVAILVIANLLIDVMGLGKKTNKFMLISNVVRYGLELVAIIPVIVMTLVIKETLGLYAVIVAVLAVIALVINIILLICYSKKPKTAKASEPVKEGEESKKETKKERKAREKAEREAAKKAAEEEAAAKKAEREAATAEAKAKKAEAKAAEKDEKPAEEQVQLYTPVIYNGEVDDFIRTLSNEQRIEFARMFLEHQHGTLPGVPEYVVSGDNTKFFSSVFIYMARIREHISDGLMNALYKQANMMR